MPSINEVGAPNAMRISGDDAKDPLKVSAAKLAAREAKVQLVLECLDWGLPASVVYDPSEYHISKADAQDSAKYRAAKAVAEEMHARLVIDPPVELPPAVRDASTVLIPKGSDHATYKRMKADAESRGVPYAVADA